MGQIPASFQFIQVSMDTLGQKVVMALMEQYQGIGHCLFIDNFKPFTSVT